MKVQNWMGRCWIVTLSVAAGLSVGAIGCGPNGGSEDPGQDTSMGQDTLADTGPGNDTFEPDPDTGGDTSEPDTDETTAPEISNVNVTENPNNILSAFVDFETDISAEATLEIVKGDTTVQTLGPSDPATSHAFDVLGLLEETSYEFKITATADGESSSVTEPFETGTLPDVFDHLHVEKTTPSQTADGYRLIHVQRWKKPSVGLGPVEDWGLALAIDERGRVVWYHRTGIGMLDLIRNSAGNFMYTADHKKIVEITPTGETVREWSAEQDLNRKPSENKCCIHHEIFEQQNGNFLTLSTEMQTVSGYAEDGSDANVVGDVALQISPDGDVLDTWSMFDVLSDYKTRKKPGATGDFWDDEYGGTKTNDWTHGNSVGPGSGDGTLISSLRHQDWIVQWDKQSGDLQWRLGPEGDFEFPQGSDGTFQYHQHAPEWQDNGNLLVYDNGNARPTIEPGNTYYTRVVEYALDASNVDIDAGQKGTVEQVWSYKYEPGYYAPFVGDADRTPNGNVLIMDGGLQEKPEECIDFENGEPIDKTGRCIVSKTSTNYVRLLEVTHEDQPQKLFDVRFHDRSDDPYGYHGYRVDLIETLYPNGDASGTNSY